MTVLYGRWWCWRLRATRPTPTVPWERSSSTFGARTRWCTCGLPARTPRRPSGSSPCGRGRHRTRSSCAGCTPARPAPRSLSNNSCAPARTLSPEGVKELIAQRVGRLTTVTGESLRAAAAIGTEFELGVLEQLAGGREPVLAALDAALTAGLVVEVGSSPGRFAFVDALARDLRADVRNGPSLHQRIGEALDQRPGTAHAERASRRRGRSACSGGEGSRGPGRRGRERRRGGGLRDRGRIPAARARAAGGG